MRYYPVAARQQELSELRTRLADPTTGHPATCGCGSAGTYTQLNRDRAATLTRWPVRIVTPYGSAVHAANNHVTRCAMALRAVDRRLSKACADVTCDRCLKPADQPTTPGNRPSHVTGNGGPTPGELEAWQVERLRLTVAAALAGNRTAAGRALRILGVDRPGLGPVVAALWPYPDGR